MRRRRLASMNASQRETPMALSSRIPLVSLIQTLAVAEHLNFRHAARALGVSLSSVSARVKALEKDLGVILFERHARGVRLTEAGRRFVELVAVGVDQIHYAVNTAGMAASGECGRLRIGVHALISGGFLARLIERFRDKHQGVDIEILEGTARETLMHLRSNRLDVVFVAGTPELPDCHTRPMWTEQLMVALPERHPLARQSSLTWSELAEETFLVRYGSTGPQVHDHIVLRLAGLWPAPSILRVDVGRDALLSMVGQGFGITIFGAATALLSVSGVVFLPITDEPQPVAFSAVWSPFNQGAALRNLLALANKMGQPDPLKRIQHESARPMIQ